MEITTNKNRASRPRWKLFLMAGFMVVLAACSGSSDEAPEVAIEELIPAEVREAAAAAEEPLERFGEVAFDSDYEWKDGFPPPCPAAFSGVDIADMSVGLSTSNGPRCFANDGETFGHEYEINLMSNLLFPREVDTVPFAGGELYEFCSDQGLCTSGWLDGTVEVVVMSSSADGSNAFLSANLVSILEWAPSVEFVPNSDVEVSDD